MSKMKDDSKNFYKKLGVKGLAKLTSKSNTDAYIKFIKSFTSKDKKILDVACGYGRLTIPLFKLGYDIQGIDISPNLIDEAKKQSEKNNLKIKFKIGDMQELPYKDNSFDVIICIWSSFCHMLTQIDQIKAIKEMFRILDYGGLIIIDLPYFKKPTKQIKKYGNFIENSQNLFRKKIRNLEDTLFLQTKETILDLFEKITKIKNYNLKFKNIAGKRRLIVFVKK